MRRYFILFLLLLVTEVAIALFHFHTFVRGFIGDLLVTPLLYALLRGTTKITSNMAIVLVLIIAFSVELLQLLNITDLLNIQHPILTTIIGTTFDWRDLFAYCLGAILVILIEKSSK